MIEGTLEKPPNSTDLRKKAFTSIATEKFVRLDLQSIFRLMKV
jgi:hypothetical protein